MRCIYKLFKQLFKINLNKSKMPRKKIKYEDKNVKFGITIHPELAALLETKSKEKNITKSKMIQIIIIEHFKKQNKI